MELYDTQLGKVLEQLKVALLSHTPIAYLPTNDMDFIKELLYSEDTHGSLVPRLWKNGNGFLICLNSNEFYTKGANGDVYIADNYYFTSSFSNVKKDMPFIWVVNTNNWQDVSKTLKEFLNLYLDIKTVQKYNKSSDVDNVRRSLCIVITPKRLPIPDEFAPYVKKIEIPVLSDEEIADNIRIHLTGHGCDESILPQKFVKQLIVSLRGFSKSKIRHMFAEMFAKQYIQKNRVDEKGILAIVRAEKRALMEDTRGLKWENVGSDKAAGLASIEDWIKERIDLFDSKKASVSYTDIPKGLLISGIPGSGKSLMAKTAASLVQYPLISLDMGAMLGGLVGESEHNMIDALHMAEQMAPCVLWIDEIEKAFSGSSQNASSGDSGVGRRMFGKFLTWMQEKSSACFVFATSNDISVLPPELFRAERFDCKYFTFMPSVEECASIFSCIIKKQNDNYKKGMDELPSSKAALKPQFLFAPQAEDPKFWIDILNENCAAGYDLTLQCNEGTENKQKNRKYIWRNGERPRFKLLTGADISALIKEIKFDLSKKRITTRGVASCVYDESMLRNTAVRKLNSQNFKPYGETNVLDIVKCFYRLYINQFVPASGKCILDFDKYVEDDNYYRHEGHVAFENRYDEALYYLLVGAINYYGSKIKA